MEREIDGGDRCSVCSVAGSAPTRRCEEEAEPEGKALYLLVPILTYGHDLWVVTERMRSQIQAPKMGSPLEIG